MMGEKSEVKRRRPTKRMDKTLVNRYWASVEPTSREELAVHPKKLEEIDHWIERNAIRKQSRPAPILLLVGPTGSGKTASVRVISKEKKVEVQEWTNQLPDANQFGTDKDIWDRDIPTTSQTAKFSEFLLRSGHYGSLQLTTESVLPENLLGKLILVEDIPNFCLRDPLVLHSLLEKYRQCGRFPLVLIISESSSKADSNSRKLVPPKVCEELGIETISMNPIATTLMLKALERIASREKQAGNLSDLPTKSVLTDLAEKSRGDIRAALNSLQFSLMTKSDVDSEVTVKGKRKQLGKVPRKTPKFEEREENLLLFSALGKILYSKRSTDKPEPIHSAVAPQDRHKFSLELEPEDVVEKSHVDGMMFVCYLHENYVDFHQDIEVVERSAYYLSLADTLNNDWRATMERSGHDSATSIAVRAMAHYLDRSASGSVTGGATKKAGNWHPIRKPEWFAVWKKFEAGQIQLPVLPGINENLVDVKTTGDLTDIEIESYDDWDDW